MKISELIKKAGWRWLTDCDGSCPCGEAYIGGIHIRTQCWRSGACHPYSCVHVWSGQDFWLGSKITNRKELSLIARMIAKDIRESWHTEVAVSLRPFSYGKVKNK